MRLLVVGILADAGFDTAEASNAAQALELLKNPILGNFAAGSWSHLA